MPLRPSSFSGIFGHMLTLPVTKRDASMTLSALRSSGMVPAVVYGAHHPSTPISVEAKAFAKAMREAGEATVVALAGLGAELPVLIHKVDFDPITDQPQHADFYAVTKGETVEVAIPLEFIGESAAVAQGANLVKVLHEIDVEADPMSLPHAITVDISLLKEVDDQIHAKDLALPAGVTLAVDPNEVVALAQEVVEESAEQPAADLSAIKVEKKGKEEEAGSGD